MDWTMIGGITSSITAVKDIAEGLRTERDEALIREKTTALWQEVLKAREGLIAHNAALLQLQQEHFEAGEKLRKLEETARERGNYSLVHIGRGQWVYRSNVAPQHPGAAEVTPAVTEPPHYLCQTCFDKGVKSVLQTRFERGVDIGLRCLSCGDTLLSEAGIKYAGTPNVSPNGVTSYPSI